MGSAFTRQEESASLTQNQHLHRSTPPAPPPTAITTPSSTEHLSLKTAVACRTAPDRQALRNPSRLPAFPGTHGSFDDDDSIPVLETVAEQPEPDPAVSADASLTVSTRVEYTALPRGQTQDVFGLVTVEAPSAPAPETSSTASQQDRQPMDLICVLDVSGSMRGDKIQQVQDATRFIIDQSTPKDRLGIVTFNSNAQRVLRLRKMDTDGKDSANVETLRLTAGGGTSIASGLSLALSVMEQRRQRNKVASILLLTDGQDGSTRSQLPALIARAQEANCSIYSFGFGKDHDASLLAELAEQAQTPFTFVEDTGKIREAFAGAVGGLSSIVAQGVELAIQGNVSVKNVHTPFRIQRTSGTNVTVAIPDIFAGERRNILVELEVPAGGNASENATLLQAHVRYTDLRSGMIVQSSPATMEIMRVDEPQPEAEPDQEVSAQRSRVEVTRALQEAATHSDRGQFVEAQRVLDMADQSMQVRGATGQLCEALSQELVDARSRMRSRSLWESGGRAEVNDALQMQRMERCTNLMESSSAACMKSSKQMYCNASQSSWIFSSKSR